MKTRRKARGTGRTFLKGGLTKETYNQIQKTINAMSLTKHSCSFMLNYEKKTAMTTNPTA